MTLVIGRKFKDITYLIADTASSISMTSEKASPIVNPTCKILCYRDAAVAYAGDTYYLPNLIDMRDTAADFDAFRQTLLNAHVESNGKIDFLVLNITSRLLSKIALAGVEELDATYIGSQDAFARFQTERHAAVAEGSTFVTVTLQPECSQESGAIYSFDLLAFNRALQAERDDAGGFAVPFFADATKHIYGHYFIAIRRPLAWHEISSGIPRPVDLQGAEQGAFSINFAGTDDSFACHIRQCNLGIECNYQDFGIESKKYKLSEQEFQKRVKAARGIMLATTIQRHPIDFIIRSLIMRKNGQLAEAIAEATAGIETILASCTDKDGKNLDGQYQFLTEVFDAHSEIQVPLEHVGYIMQAVRLRYEYLVQQGLDKEVAAAVREMELIQMAQKSKVKWTRSKPPLA
jgi:hypothetical protein